MSDSSQPHGLQPTRLLRPWDSPGKSTGVGCHGQINKGVVCVSTQSLSHSESLDLMNRSPPVSSVHGILQARILEWVAIPFSKGYSQPRDQICISSIAGGFLTTESLGKPKSYVHIDVTYKICINRLLILLVRLLINSRLFVVKFGENQMLYGDF